MNRDIRIIDGQRWVRVPECKACTAVHETFPTTRHFHSPLCPDRNKCAECGAEIPGLFCDYLTQQVGAICARCAAGEEAAA